LTECLPEQGCWDVVYQVDTHFTVDCSRRFVRGPDSDIHLRPKSFRVLEFLIENRDRAISKDELLTTVWDGMAVTDDVLVTSITELRRAFGDDARASTFIKTIHGTVYRWIAPVVDVTPIEAVQAEPASPRPQTVDEAAQPDPRSLRKPALIAAGVLVIVSAAALSLRTSHAPTSHFREIGWWRFDEPNGNAILDSSGRGNSGQISSGVKRVAGRIGGALYFDGTGDGVSGTAGNLMPAGNSPRTITMWIKTDSTSGDFANLFHYGQKDPTPREANFGFVLRPDGVMRVGNGQATGYVEGQARLDDRTWHMLSAVYDGPPSNQERLYVDGYEDGEGSLSRPPATINGGTWRIGRFLSGGTPFRGTLDDVRIYDRALTPAEVHALFRCSARFEDLKSAATYYFLPLVGAVPNFVNGEIRNSGRDIGGVQLASSNGTCSTTTLDGVTLPQDLYLSAELKTPGDTDRLRTEAGIYFRSRQAHAGDGIMGGTSGGYWVRLRTGGQVMVTCLNPARVVAFTTVAGLAPEEFNRLEVTAIGTALEVSLNGKLLEFDQGGKRTTRVSIPPEWDGPPKVGANEGAVGIAFSADLNRGGAGGQAARNFIVRPAAGFSPQD